MDGELRADCDAPGFTRTLLPVAQPAHEARAYWLDAHTLRWPGAAREGAAYEGKVRLYASAKAALRADPGRRVPGADAAFDLVPAAAPDAAIAQRFAFTGPGPEWTLAPADATQLKTLLRGQLLLVREDARGRVLEATRIQSPGALDALYAEADEIDDLGATPEANSTRWRLWAPTAQRVAVCTYQTGNSRANGVLPLQRDDATGAWSAQIPRDLSGTYYTYLVDVFVPGTGLVRNRVTDPYSISVTTDSLRSWIGRLDAAETRPEGWDATSRPTPLAAPTDMAIYELHVRDFSRDDASVPQARRGKYLAFAETDSQGMRHLRALRAAGMTDIHLLPVFDIASVPEAGCFSPIIPDAAADSDAQQAAVAKVAANDCYNWGYDPYHFNAPEGSYASDPADGAVRVREFRAMVQALHAAGLRVGMDVVYNHTNSSGQHAKSVLDRIVPGYYYRLDASGKVEQSTCCDNTATEHRMMGKLMRDSAALWAREYHIDSFRFDLMGHQPRAEMERLQREVDAAAGRHVELIGEGWNFGEIADGKRFVQASQTSLNGSGIGTFSDRARDAIRGGGPSDHGDALRVPGYVNGLADSANRDALLHAADLVRVGLAGTLLDYRMTDASGRNVPLAEVDYKGQPAGYASAPGEVVNYVENHDNQTLFDINAWKLPADTTREDRARVQLLALALNTFSQGVAYFHAGGELLRSKSLDRNSFDSGDWFNRIDWSGRDNFYGTGLPPAADNARDWKEMRPLLTNAGIEPTAKEIGFVRDAFNDLLSIRVSTTLLRLRSAEDIKSRLNFPNSGPDQNPLVMAGHVDGNDYPGAGFRELLYLVNVSPQAQTLLLPEQAGKRYVLHPVQAADSAADPRPRREARYEPNSGRFTVPARTVVVYVLP